MDMVAAVQQHEIEELIEERDNSNVKLILVAPSPDVLPEDGFLEYAVAADVKALIAAGDQTVLLFRESGSNLLKMLVEYQDEFELRVKVLEGLPNVDYAIWFSQLTWSQDEVSYSGLLSELSLQSSAERELRENSLTKHDRERAQVSRADGTVRDNTKFGIVGSDDDDDSIADEV
nr:P7 [Red mite associated cystovirus]